MATVKTQRLKYVLTDFLTANAAFFAFDVYRYLNFDRIASDNVFRFLSETKMVAEQCVIPAILLGLYWLSGYYNQPFKKSRLQEFFTTFFSALIAMLLIYLTLLTNDQSLIVSTNYMMMAVLFGVLFVFTYIGRLTITSLTIKNLRKRHWRQPSIIIGSSEEGLEMASRLSDPRINIGYDIIGFVPIDNETSAKVLPAPVISLEELPEKVEKLGVKQIFIAPEKMDDRKILSLVTQLYPLDTSIRIAPDTLDYVTSSIHLQDIYAEPFVDLTSPKVSEASKNIKRLIDVVFSVAALTLLAIPAIVISVLVKRSSPGPVFYRQERIGYRQRPFNILKFRTMRTDAEASGPQLTGENDSRITGVGRTLRKYRLDELPQFWNVLRGDMSIVGPRPERAFFISQIVEKAPYYTLVHQVRPGITSWGMVKFGYASTVDEMVARTRFDLIYLSNMSIAVDFKIMIYTIRTVLTGKGK